MTLPKFSQSFTLISDESERWDQWRNEIEQIHQKNPLERSDTERFTQISVVELLYEIKNDHDIVVVDVGQHQMWCAQRFRAKYPRTFLGS